MYDKIETLAIKAANPNTTEEERKDYNLEFNDYKEQLENLMVSRYNDKLLFSNTLMCGGPKNIELKNVGLAQKGGASHPVRAQTVFTGSPSGTVSFRVNSGVIGDNYRVWMGNICVFSAGPLSKVLIIQNNIMIMQQVYQEALFQLQELRHRILILYPGHGWRTSGGAKMENDLFEITFAPGEKTTYKVIPGASNDDGAGNSNWFIQSYYRTL